LTTTATQVGTALQVIADPGSVIFVGPLHVPFRHVRQITFQTDPVQHGKFDVLDDGKPVVGAPFAIASIDRVNVSVAGLDAVNVDDSFNGLPFKLGTTVSLFGSGSFNSLNLT